MTRTFAKLAGKPQKIKSAKLARTSIRVHYYNRPPWIPEDVFSGCNNKCHLTMGDGDSYTGSAVVVFHIPYVIQKYIQKRMGQIWVFHSLEPPVMRWSKSLNWKNVFNWTISYRRDADIHYPYGTFNAKKYQGDLEKQSNKLYKKWQNKPKNIVWMVSHCNTSGQRSLYVKELKKVINVDVYGKCGIQNQCPRIKTTECLKPYKFYLSFESKLCEDYLTEKTFKVYESNIMTLPIVRSGSNLSMFLPPGSYIDTSTFNNKRNLVGYIKSLSKAKERFKKYIQWRKHYKLNAHNKHKIAFCELCRRLHSKDVHKYQRLYSDIGGWLRGDNVKQNYCREANDIH
ncbi:alpha-(1,3)-fucosyltransferase C-like [Argopecten irradians]|uniref:alpha-(1,3)-fucosyltransferase C-like n=1 Tax=Argopecten irradians TaxID=31199 RepID=UPI003721630B